MSYTIPSDSHTTGDSGHTTDHNDIVDVLKGNSAAYSVLNTAYSGGADPTGVADSTAAFAAAIAALPSGGGNIIVPPGSYKITGSGLTFNQDQGMTGAGSSCTFLNYTGSGTCITITISGTFTGGQYAGRFSGFYLNGYSAGSSAVGIQYGNLQGIQMTDVAVYGFGGTGLYCVNTSGNWSEQNNVQARIVQCGTAGSNTSAAVVFDTSSFDYGNFDFTIVSGNGTGGVYFQNGAQLTGGSLRMRGNFYGAAGNTAAVIALDKAGGSGTSYIKATLFDVAVESAGSNTGHYTVYMGSSNSASQFLGTGVLSFSNVAINFQGYSNSDYVPFGFSGIINDEVLGAMTPGDGIAIQGAVEWGSNGSLSSSPGGGSTVYFQFGDVIEFRLSSGSNTLSFSGAPSVTARRADLWIAQPASGSAGTVVWPGGAGGVKWASASAPALSSTNGYVDHIRLTFLPDTGYWYGELAGTHYA